jgi:uridine kinase
MIKPIVIAMAGDSGVGKTTIAKVFSIFLGPENCTILHGDDLHKYPRNHEMWNVYTHLHPDANDLELGDKHLRELCSLKPILRSHYNHKTGFFDAPVEIVPNKYIIDDGLHALYTETYLNLSNIKIYIDAPHDLICHWKINRDIKERSTTLEQVLESIERRKPDSLKYIQPQRDNCDVIVNFKLLTPIKRVGDPNEVANIDIEYIIKNDFKFNSLCEHIFSNLKLYTEKINEYTIGCMEIAQNKSLIHGNVSMKIDDNLMAIKSCGKKLSDIYHASGFSILYYNYIRDYYSASNHEVGSKEMLEVIESSCLKYEPIASTESALHALLPGCVVHTNSSYLNDILSHKESKKICVELFGAFDYEYFSGNLEKNSMINMISRQEKKKQVYLFENHGLIVSGPVLKECIKTTKYIHLIAENFSHKDGQ